jgi:hypothetical protein
VATYFLDYSAGKLPAGVIKSTPVGPAGEHASGVIRYIDAPNLLGTKHTDLAEYQDDISNGLTVLMFFEVNENDALGGFAQGQSFAQRAKAGADYLGYSGPIIFCCDRWMANQPSIPVSVWQAYLDGAVSVLGRSRVGAYGFADAMDAALGHVDFFVQCGARSVVRDFVNIWQDNNVQPDVGGIQTDRLLVLKPITQGDTMNLDQDAVLHEIRDILKTPMRSAVILDNGKQSDVMFDPRGAWVNADLHSFNSSRKLDALLGLVAQKNGVTADQIAAALQPGIVAALLPALEPALAKALGADNTAQAAAVAAAVIADLAANLATPATPPVIPPATPTV